MKQSIARLGLWGAALALLGACATVQPAPSPEPQRYTGTLRQWFEGQSFTPDGEEQGWFYGIDPGAAQKLAAALPPDFVAPPEGVAIRAEIMGVVTRVSEETRYLSPLTAPWEYYITITDVISARAIPAACGRVEWTIYFDSNSAEVSPAGRAEIDRQLGWVRQHLCNVASMQVVGGADTVGSTQANLLLSERRAAAASAVAVTLGFRSDMIQIVSRGETELARPTGDNMDEPLNRSVRIIIESPPPAS